MSDQFSVRSLQFTENSIVSQFFSSIDFRLRFDAGLLHVETRHAVSLRSHINTGFPQKLQKYSCFITMPELNRKSKIKNSQLSRAGEAHYAVVLLGQHLQ